MNSNLNNRSHKYVNQDIGRLTSGRLLARNVVNNLIGQIIPMLVAIFTLPLIIKGLGTNRFGVLSLAWIIIGYFTLFDFGLGRVLTQMVAEKLSMGQDEEIPALVWTSLLLMVIFGIMGALVLGLLSPWLVHYVLKIPDELKKETLNSLYLLAISLPFIISIAGFRGILEANQRFDLTNIIKIITGIITYGTPLIVLMFTKSLAIVIAVLLIGRVINWGIFLALCFHIMPSLRQFITLKYRAIGPLLRFGSWMTVSNIISPLLSYLDRFLVGSLVSMAAVAYYSMPYEIVTKLGIIPGSIIGVLFPAFAASFGRDMERTILIFSRGVKYLWLIMFPIILCIITFAHEIIYVWVGPEFARNSTIIFQLLAIGVFINGMAYLPFSLLQGIQRPDITAKVHLIELPFYLCVIWWLIHKYGIEGAAIAWVLRVSVDCVFMYLISWRFMPNSGIFIKNMSYKFGVTLMILFIVLLLKSVSTKIIFIVPTMLLYISVTWFLIFNSDERAEVHNRIKILRQVE